METVLKGKFCLKWMSKCTCISLFKRFARCRFDIFHDSTQSIMEKKK